MNKRVFFLTDFKRGVLFEIEPKTMIMKVLICSAPLVLGVMLPVAGYGYEKRSKTYEFSKQYENIAIKNYVVLLPASETKLLILNFKQIAYGLYKALPTRSYLCKFLILQPLHPKSMIAV